MVIQVSILTHSRCINRYKCRSNIHVHVLYVCMLGLFMWVCLSMYVCESERRVCRGRVVGMPQKV